MKMDNSGHTFNYGGTVITAGDHARQHNGNVYGGVTNNYQTYGTRAPFPGNRTGPGGRSVDDYTIAWICALPVPEFQASQLLIDERHEGIPLPPSHTYSYVFGKINGHNVVMGCLPDTVMGKAAASSVASEMKNLFPKLRFALLVGVGGGVPSEQHDIRLGDVVVSRPDKDRQTGGVIQYDYGKAMQDGTFQEMGSLNMPPMSLLSALGTTRASLDSNFYDYLESYGKHKNRVAVQYAKKPTTADRLFESEFVHPPKALNCLKCPAEHEIPREERGDPAPVIHYGTIASGDEVIKSSIKRDQIAEKHGILCFEMEAAGFVNQLPCLVIRGICDYCDSHKNKGWQPYAAAAAAAWAKELLRNIAPSEVQSIPGAENR